MIWEISNIIKLLELNPNLLQPCIYGSTKRKKKSWRDILRVYTDNLTLHIEVCLSDFNQNLFIRVIILSTLKILSNLAGDYTESLRVSERIPKAISLWLLHGQAAPLFIDLCRLWQASKAEENLFANHMSKGALRV